jgi:hypothetical protein
MLGLFTAIGAETTGLAAPTETLATHAHLMSNPGVRRVRRRHQPPIQGLLAGSTHLGVQQAYVAMVIAALIGVIGNVLG